MPPPPPLSPVSTAPALFVFVFHRKRELSVEEVEGFGRRHCWAMAMTATSSTPPTVLSCASPSETARKPDKLSFGTDHSAHVFHGVVVPVKGRRPGWKLWPSKAVFGGEKRRRKCERGE